MKRVLWLPLIVLALGGSARAQQQVKSRVMVLLDTSGSMGLYFRDPATWGDPPNGDYPGGDGSTSYTDRNVANQSKYPGKLVGGVRDGVNSRLYAAKSALNGATYAYSGDIDFGLMTYDFQLCSFNSPLCNQCDISGNFYTCVYANNTFTSLTTINWISRNCNGSGGRLIAQTAPNSPSTYLPWIDGIEDHQDSGNGTTPINPEIRGNGPTPLAQAISAAKTQWYDVVKVGDPQVNCRPYVLVVETDGDDTCGGNPVTAVQAVSNANPANPVKTYVIGLAARSSLQTVLNNMANAGGTGQARFANNQTEIEAAFADIAASSVKYEMCNGQDDNCNGLIDEGMGAYQECTQNGECNSASCSSGRCTCNINTDCRSGYLCDTTRHLCVPSCSAGEGQCLRTGVRKCSGAGTACCENDGQASCTPLAAGAGTTERCNGLDDDCNGIVDDPPVCQTCNPTTEICNGVDDDCNGTADDNPVDVGRPCGLSLGICQPGSTLCQGGRLICDGGTPPAAVACNGCDNNCDGVLDQPTRACYGGPQGTENVGVCRGGLQRCQAQSCPQAASWGPCVGENLPSNEICNGLDDDCNGTVDDVAGSGVDCCPWGSCGTGTCTAGTMQCSGGTLQCVGGQGPGPEICNGLDDDCNGQVDDLPNLGNACTPSTGCNGTLVCDTVKQQVVCQPAGMSAVEVCNGLDDDCDGEIDEQPDVSNSDTRLGKSCGNTQGRPLPCKAGTTICKNGGVVCDGEVGPGMEVCDGVDNDCDGTVDSSAPCPTGFVCYQGACDLICGGGEFPCPGGYSPVSAQGICLCVADKPCAPACPADKRCDTATGQCVDPCRSVVCPAPLQCDQGVCVGCENPRFACAAGQRCDRANHACIADLCYQVQCGASEFCNPTDGKCKPTCGVQGCPLGQICQAGQCVSDPCTGVSCSTGQTCDPKNGQCVQNGCAFKSCGANLACCQDACVADPCSATRCPDRTVCHVDPLDCAVSCDALSAAKRDQIVGAGGSGFACAMGGREGVPPLAWLLVIPLLARLGRRRRRRRWPRPLEVA